MKNLFKLSTALRWALLGLTFSEISNSIFEGSVIPSIIIVGLPAWALAFNRTFGVISDFMSPAAAWIVDKFGSFASLSAAEFCEGLLCLIVAILPHSWLGWKWSLLALGCLLLVTGQIIDVASEIFEVDISGDNEEMLIEYSGYVGIIMSVGGTLFGTVLGSALTSISITLVLIISSVLSFACTLTRFLSRGSILSATSASLNDDNDDNETDAQHGISQRHTTKSMRIILLSCTFFLSLIPSLYGGYTTLGYADKLGSHITTVIYAVTGVATIASSYMYLRASKKLSLRIIGCAGVISMIIGLIFLSIPIFWSALIGWALMDLGYSCTARPLIVSRQLLIEHDLLTKFSGWARLASALAAAGGSWLGWIISQNYTWQILPTLSLVPAIILLPAVWSSLHKGRK